MVMICTTLRCGNGFLRTCAARPEGKVSDLIGFATQVNVRLGEENGNLIWVVRDNGNGITEDQLSVGTSLGILGMRELLGGTLTISGAPGKGTTVRVQLPDSNQAGE